MISVLIFTRPKRRVDTEVVVSTFCPKLRKVVNSRSLLDHGTPVTRIFGGSCDREVDDGANSWDASTSISTRAERY